MPRTFSKPNLALGNAKPLRRLPAWTFFGAYFFPSRLALEPESAVPFECFVVYIWKRGILDSDHAA